MCAWDSHSKNRVACRCPVWEKYPYHAFGRGRSPIETDLDGDTPLFCGPGRQFQNPPERCGFQQLGAGIRRQDLCTTKLDKRKFSKEQLAKVIGEEEEGWRQQLSWTDGAERQLCKKQFATCVFRLSCFSETVPFFLADRRWSHHTSAFRRFATFMIMSLFALVRHSSVLARVSLFCTILEGVFPIFLPAQAAEDVTETTSGHIFVATKVCGGLTATPLGPAGTCLANCVIGSLCLPYLRGFKLEGAGALEGSRACRAQERKRERW